MEHSGQNLPSLLQAATNVSKQATMATVKTDSLILVVVLRKSYTAADVSAMRFRELFFEASKSRFQWRVETRMVPLIFARVD